MVAGRTDRRPALALGVPKTIAPPSLVKRRQDGCQMRSAAPSLHASCLGRPGAALQARPCEPGGGPAESPRRPLVRLTRDTPLGATRASLTARHPPCHIAS